MTTMTPITSISHPLQIDSVSPGPGMGRIGITFCPGKCDPNGMTGSWERDLDLDLDAVKDWGASAVVTLLEDWELEYLGVQDIGREVIRRKMSWFQLPIADGEIPDQAFEEAWQEAGEELRSILRSGGNVVVHCRGGLGRAGMIASRLLIELGMKPGTAMAEVREARLGAIETDEQALYVLGVRPVPKPRPVSKSAPVSKSRPAPKPRT